MAILYENEANAVMVVKNDGGRSKAGFRGHTGDCVIRAIAIATEMPYREIYDDLQSDVNHYREFGRKSRLRDRLRFEKAVKTAGVRNGIYKRFFRLYLADLGWLWTPTMTIGSGCRVHLRADELPAGRLIVSVSKHLVAVIDGVIHDTHDCSREGTRCVYGYWTKPATAKERQ